MKFIMVVFTQNWVAFNNFVIIILQFYYNLTQPKEELGIFPLKENYEKTNSTFNCHWSFMLLFQ